MATNVPGAGSTPPINRSGPVRRAARPGLRRSLLALGAVLTVGLAACGTGASSAGSDGDTITMGTVPWLGYAPWAIADEKGCFDKAGIDVKLVNFNTDMESAFIAGKIDVENTATHMVPNVLKGGMKAKAVLLEDASLDADAILGGPDVTSIADLKGKKVAYEKGSTSDLLLQWKLQQEGMSIDDIDPVPMTAQASMTALAAGKVDAAVSYEPYIADTKASGAEFHTLGTAGEDEGLISDVLVVPQTMIDDHPDQVQGLVDAWGCAMDYEKAHPDESMQIMADALGSKVEDIEPTYKGVRLYDASEQSLLGGQFSSKVLPSVVKASMEAGLMDKDYTAGELIDPQFANTVAEK